MTNVATMPAKEPRPPEMTPPELPAALQLKAIPPRMEAIEEHVEWPLLSRLPLQLITSIPLPRLRVRDLLALRPGQLVASAWSSTEDVPLRLGTVQLSWCEFEVVEKRMAVRLTRLA